MDIPSTSKRPPLLPHGEVHKRLIEKPPKKRSPYEFIGPFNKYDDENYEIYLKKEKQFLEAMKKYEKLNQETITSHKQRLHNDYMACLDLDFLNNPHSIVPKEEGGTTPKYLRKRTEREIGDSPEEDQSTVCNLSNWFRKYLMINKFICVARKVVLRNRMLRNLEKLKKLDSESVKQYETPPPKEYYGRFFDIFGKFVTDEIEYDDED